ncbi:helix-turn-helix domain-containing protein [Flavobacteriaceae bacterium Ap0902]|nr:helix-turn-helix domain-containing protein [Flavobacteriaceae bacterium Ap0902]
MKLPITFLLQILSIGIFLWVNPLLGQKKETDVLSYQSFKAEIKHLALAHDKNRFQKIDDYIAYAKLTQDPLILWGSYDIARLYGKPELDTVYCDSMIWIAKKGLDSLKIADSYVAKAMHLELDYKYKRALDALTQAEEYLSNSTNNLYVKNSIHYTKGLIYEEMNEVAKAKEYLNKSYQFFKNNHKPSNHTDYNLYYLLSLSHIASISAYLKNDSLSKAYNQELSKIVENENYLFHKNVIPINAGINHFVQTRYDSAIIKLNQSLNNQTPNSGVHLTEHYYIGLSYWYKNQKEKALPYLLYIDSVYKANHKLPQKFRPTYERLIDYYHDKQDAEKQLFYVKKLLALDKSFERDYKYILPQLEKTYTTQKLEEEKAYLQNLLKEKDYKQFWLVGGASLVIIILLICGVLLFIRNKKLDQNFKKLEEHYHKQLDQNTKFISQAEDPMQQETIAEKMQYKSEAENLGMSENVYALITDYLQNFELNKGYLDKNLNQQKMAEKIGTNSTYLSKVINYQKNMNFSAYIHQLRIEDATKSLYFGNERNLSVHKIAKKHGYNSEKTFVREFKRINGMTPVQFLKRVKA